MLMMACELEELGAPLAESRPAQLRQVENIAIQQRDAVDGFGGDELADSGVRRLHQEVASVTVTTSLTLPRAGRC